MIASTPKQNVPDPAARPSRPSVRFTAFDARDDHEHAPAGSTPTAVRFHPGSENRVKDRSVDVCTQYDRQHREDRGDQQLTDELGPLVESEIARVADRQVVIDEAEQARRDDHAITARMPNA
jgi:hypothetical protein